MAQANKWRMSLYIKEKKYVDFCEETFNGRGKMRIVPNLRGGGSYAGSSGSSQPALYLDRTLEIFFERGA